MSTGMRRPIRSSRPIRCSTIEGFQGRSNSTRRRQNSKLRPSPPHSVDTSRLGPAASRNRATSVSRRAGGSSSWNTPLASCARWLSAVRSISRVSRCATKTSVFSPASRQRGACASSQSRRGSPASIASAWRRSAVSSDASTALSAAPDASARRTRSIFCRRATACGATAPRTAASTASRSCQPAGLSGAIGMPTRGGKPPMSARRVELVHGGRGVARARRASKLTSSGNSSGRSSWSRRKNPWASSSSGVALRSST